RKLNIINNLKEENKKIKEEQRQQQEFLKKLSVEYVMMGKECEREGMVDAAIANYQKAIELYPDNPTAQKRLKKLDSNRDRKE
ncbi:tetratricopeptide repeat protein, partial [Prevotella histicola]